MLFIYAILVPDPMAQLAAAAAQQNGDTASNGDTANSSDSDSEQKSEGSAQ